MRRGTNVGQAYVKITADASNINHDILDAFDDVDTQQIGEDHGKEYREGFERELKTLDDQFDESVKRWSRAIDTNEGLNTSVRKMLMDSVNPGNQDKEVGAAWQKMFHHIAREAGTEFGTEFDSVLHKKIIDSVQNSLEKSVKRGDFSMKSLQDTIRGGNLDVLGPAFDKAIGDVRKFSEQVKEYNEDIAAQKAESEINWADRVRKIKKNWEGTDFQLTQRLAREHSARLLANSVADAKNRIRLAKIVGDEEARLDAERMLRAARSSEATAKMNLDAIKAEHDAWLKSARNKLEYERKQKAQFLNETKRQEDAAARIRKQIEDEAAREAAKRDSDLRALRETSLREIADAEVRMGDRLHRLRRTWIGDEARLEQRLDAERALGQAQDAVRVARVEIRQAEIVGDERARLDAESDLRHAESISRRAEAEIEVLNRVHRESLRLEQAAERLAARRRGPSIADRMAGMFGRGSRMDGIHYFGSVVGAVMKGVIGAFSLVGKAIKGIMPLARSVADTFREGFSSAAAGASGFTKTMAGFASVGGRAFAAIASSGPAALLAIAAAAGAAVVALSVVTVVASILASAISALTALATALVGTIAAGLTAGVLVLSGVLVAGAAAAGALALAFTNLNDKQKALLKGSMEPFVGTMKRIGQTMAREMAPAFETWGKNLNRFGRMMEPWAKSMGKAFGDAGKILTESFTGPGFQKLSTSLGVYLPGIIRKLSQATGDFLNGMAGMFSAIMPFVDRFATYLSDVAERFSEWANSAKGQNSISDFMERAWNSLKSFWGGLREFSGFLKDVLFNPATLKMGDGMFDSMRDSFAGFREDIKDGSLERWLEQGKVFGSALKDALSALADTFRTLSDSGTIDNIASSMRAFADVMRALDPWIKIVLDGLNILFDMIAQKMGILKPTLDAIGWVGEKLGLLGGEADGAAGPVDGIGSSIEAAADKARAAAAHVTALSGAFDLAGGSASTANRQMALSELEKIPGLFEQMQRFNIGKGDMISAALGDPAAIKRINEALSDLNPHWTQSREGIDLIRGALGSTSGQFAEVTRKAQENAVALGTLRDIYPQIPNRVVSVFEQQGIPETRRELREMISEIKMTPEQRKLVMSIFGDKEVLRAARKAGDDIEKLPDAKIGVDADVKGAEKKADSVKNMVEKTKAIFKVDANTKSANSDVKKAVSRAERFNAIFKVGANTKPANADVRKAVSRAEQFNAIFKVEANTKKSERDAIIGKKIIERLDPLFKVSAETKEAKERARSAVDTVNNMTASIKVNADMSGFNNAVANARNNATVTVRTRPGGGGGGGGKSDGESVLPGTVPLLPKTGPLTDGQGGRSTPFGFAADSGVRMGDVAAASAAATKAGEAVRRTVDDAFTSALAKPAKGEGGEKDGKKKKKLKGKLTPGVPAIYRDWARQILRSMPTFIDGLRSMMEGFNTAISDTMVAAAAAMDPGALTSVLQSQIDSMTSGVQSQVDTARSALESAAQSLLSATTKKEAKAAAKAVEAAQRNLDEALKAQTLAGEAAHILAQQQKINQSVIDAIADQFDTAGPGSSGAAQAIRDLINDETTTLADFAAARELLAGQIQIANDALASAIADRDAFESAVSGSVRSFAALTTAQAQVIDGVEQALTAGDITSNLRDRLTEVKAFQSNLNALLAMGINQDLYKQLLDAGVEVGGEYAEALLEGGVGSIDEANQLVDQINEVAEGLGQQAADHLYQSGIDVAQGVVDGLSLLSGELDAAAESLGRTIADAITGILEESLGSMNITPRPGGVVGPRALAGASRGISMSPAAAASAGAEARMTAAMAGVSGNQRGQVFRDLVVQTPTSDPKAVAFEAMNELIGRL